MTNGNDPLIFPVILSGGAGTRLWPLSREFYPKQILPLLGEFSQLQETARRVADSTKFRAPIVVCNEAHRFLVAEQLREIDVAPTTIILEPVGRNTAPAAAVAVNQALRTDAEALVLILPSDHHVGRPQALLNAVERAVPAARSGALVTFGIAPDGPETGYGYLRRGATQDRHEGVYALDRFIEKPDQSTAEAMLVEGGHYWNAGIFLFPARRYLEELERLEPAIAASSAAAISEAVSDRDFTRLSKEAFEECPSKSIDYAVMERVEDAVVVETDAGWSDIGSWSSLWGVSQKDTDGNVISGDVLVEDVANAFIHTNDQLVAAIGIRDMAVVATSDAILVAPLDRGQDVSRIVARLKAAQRSEAEFHTRVYRPWGYYQGVDAGRNFQVKRIVVYPGQSLSLQKHAHRAEHWIVVDGVAVVTCDDRSFELERNQSTFIPLGAVHRLENPGPALLTLVEVQSGDYLGEDDIVRLEDHYGRT